MYYTPSSAQEALMDPRLIPAPKTRRGPRGEPIGLLAGLRVLELLSEDLPIDLQNILLREARSHLRGAQQEATLTLTGEDPLTAEVLERIAKLEKDIQDRANSIQKLGS